MRYFVWDYKVSVFSAISFLITISVTIYVAKIIQRSTQYRVSQNKLLIDKVDDLDAHLKNLSFTVQSDGFSYKKLVASYRLLYLSSRWVIEGIIEIYPQMRRENLQDHFSRKIHDLLNLSTYTPPKKSYDIKILNDKVTYNSKRRILVLNALSDLRKDFFRLQVSIFNQ